MEKKRGCGWRKIGGLYLVGEPFFTNCWALPVPLKDCECCGQKIEFFRGYKTVTSKYLLRDYDCEPCKKTKSAPPFISTCILDHLSERLTKVGLCWVGDSFYSPQEFLTEALEMGLSKRIHALPREFKLGETWVFFAHLKAIQASKHVAKVEDSVVHGIYESSVLQPGIITAFKPKRVELIITEDMQDLDWVQGYEKRGVTLVTVPNEEKHRPQKKKSTKRQAYVDSLNEDTDQLTID